MFQLRISDKILETVEDFELAHDFKEKWAQDAIAFCKSWLQGQEHFLLQTSGSTGKPKVIEVHREQMIASALATAAFLGTNSQTKILNCLHPAYIAGKMNLVRALVWNCPICCEAPSNDPISAESQAFDPDFITLVPMQLSQLLTKPKKTKNLKYLLVGGAALSERQKTHIVDADLPAWQTYGMTETVSHIALAKIEQGPLIYRALPQVEIGQDEQGCLWVKAAMSKDQVIQTNDFITLYSDSTFSWKGRKDFVINSGGIKLHPELLEPKIEPVIQEVLPGSEFFLTGVQDEVLGEKMVLIVESEDEDLERSTLILEQISHVLDKYEVPKRIFYVKSLSRTTSGKLDRRASLDSIGLT